MENEGTSAPIVSQLVRMGYANATHAAGAFPTQTLADLEDLLPRSMERSAETGCGKSTIMFSNISSQHHVFTFDDRDQEASSVRYYEDCPITIRERVIAHFGATQRTLPAFEHNGGYDAVLIDGPHGWPFPELEYYFFYPHIKTGGFLIIDDVAIPTISRLADVLAEDEMWRLVKVVGSNTAVFQRTESPTFNPFGDGWWLQRFNRHRVSPNREIFLAKEGLTDTISAQAFDRKLSG